MGFLQAVLGGLFTILGAGSLFFIAYKALTIGNDITEMKELLRQMQSATGAGAATPATVASRAFSPSLDNFQAAVDTYEPPTPAPVAPTKPEREFVLPPPISRRLDAERGIRRDAAEDSRMR